MSEEIDKSIHKKYDVQSKLGKGVSVFSRKSSFMWLVVNTGVMPSCYAGVRYRMEGCRQKDKGGCCAQEDI